MFRETFTIVSPLSYSSTLLGSNLESDKYLYLFREVYEFSLSQSDMALQTLNLHICRYDNYSRRTSVGDVFLALAELSAQGIDLTREVFLCRNIISHQEARVIA